MLLKKSCTLWLLAVFVCLAAGQRHVKIVLAGDSTVNDEGGWGTGFASSFNENVEVVNLAKNGEAPRAFETRACGLP